MTDRPARPAMTMREIREALGHTTSPVSVEVSRYTVSLLPRDDVNFHAFALYVQRRNNGWGITDGARWVEGPHGHWTLDYYEALSFTEADEALTLARKLAPTVTVNGMTAAEAYRRTHRPA